MSYPDYRHMIIVSLLGVMMTAGISHAAPWKIGLKAPELKTISLEGAVPDTRGKILLLDFWASWCGPCKSSFPALDLIQKKYAARGLVIIGVSVDETRAAMQTFLETHPVSFATVRDAGQKLVASAGIDSMPTSFLIDRAGIIRGIHNGFYPDKTVAELEKEIEALLKTEARAK